MALKTSALNSVREEFDLPYAGDVLHIIYNPQGYTPALEREINTLRESESSAQAVVKILKSMLIDWDLEKTVPVDADNPKGPQHDVPFGVEDEDLMELPVKFLGDVSTEIANEIKALGEQGKTSGGTSQPTAS